MTSVPFQEASTALQSLSGLRCWHVSCGGCTLPSFQLALGAKVPRHIPLKNAAQDEQFRRCEGEANLLVWCTWRLDAPDAPVTSSDDTAENIGQGLHRLLGAAVARAALTAPAGDLRMEFANGLCLHVFCDHLPGDPSFDGNWELRLPEVAVFVGPGAHLVIERRAVLASTPSHPNGS